LRRLVWPALAAAIGIAILLALGTWQLQRLAWKTALLDRIQTSLTGPPIPAPPPEAWSTLDFGELDYRPVAVTGRFLNGEEIYANATLTQPKGPLGGYGFFVMTPFRTDAGWIVYVNRGFVPRAEKSPDARRDGRIEGETTVVGPLRLPIRRAWFMPADDSAGNEWFSRDPALYAEAQGRDPALVAPYLIDARADPTLPAGLPQGGETIVDLPNNHLGYAITWFGLAAALAGVFVAFARSRLAGEGRDGRS
jgi:surfeit locus 1 family protein